MPTLPKIVYRNLQKPDATTPHPDVDVLTALAENALKGSERDRVLQHLSSCADCRQIISLAFPETEVAVSPIVVPGSTSWLRWPVLKWGAIAACALTVGAAVVLHQKAPSRNAEMAVSISPSSDAGSNAAFTRSEQVLPEQKIEKRVPQLALNGSSNAVSASDSLQDEKDLAAVRDNVRKLKVAPAAPPAEYAKDDSRKELEEFRQDGEKERDSSSFSSENKQSMPAQKAAAMADSTEPVLGKAKEPLQKTENETSGLRFSSKGSPARLDQPAMGSLILAPRWTLSSEGVLMRSFNAGKTWDAIPVANNVQFRAVNAVGNEIWVGGSQGVLYHSSDAGNLWTRVTPSAEGVVLSSDIIAIEFADTLHGKLTTSDHFGWTTVDGGQTWTRQ